MLNVHTLDQKVREIIEKKTPTLEIAYTIEHLLCARTYFSDLTLDKLHWASEKKLQGFLCLHEAQRK